MTAARRRLLVGGLLIGAAAWAVGWLLAGAQASAGAAAVRAVADCAAVAALGLAAVPALDEPRHRATLATAASGPLAAVGVVWLLAEAARLSLAAAQAAAIPLVRLPIRTAAEFAVHTIGGRADLVSVAAAALVCLLALIARPTTAVGFATAGIAAVGVAARAVAGHLSESGLGAVALTVHALAAGLWCGTLAALAVTVHHRGQWARVLPRFSELSLICVAVLLIGGVTGALIILDSPAQLLVSGYGRVLLAKVVLTIALLILAWRNRTNWLPAARAHRATAKESQARSRTELALMAATLTLAAALAVTG